MTTKRRTIMAFLLSGAVLFACNKGEVDPSTLNNNPFDKDYTGASVFEVDTTYAQTISTPTGPVVNQIIAFHVKRELLLNHAAYQVRVHDIGYGLTSVISPIASGSDHFNYSRYGLSPNDPVCLTLALFNNNSSSRADQVCATLQ